MPPRFCVGSSLFLFASLMVRKLYHEPQAPRDVVPFYDDITTCSGTGHTNATMAPAGPEITGAVTVAAERSVMGWSLATAILLTAMMLFLAWLASLSVTKVTRTFALAARGAVGMVLAGFWFLLPQLWKACGYYAAIDQFLGPLASLVDLPTASLLLAKLATAAVLTLLPILREDDAPGMLLLRIHRLGIDLDLARAEAAGLRAEQATSANLWHELEKTSANLRHELEQAKDNAKTEAARSRDHQSASDRLEQQLELAEKARDIAESTAHSKGIENSHLKDETRKTTSEFASLNHLLDNAETKARSAEMQREYFRNDNLIVRRSRREAMASLSKKETELGEALKALSTTRAELESAKTSIGDGLKRVTELKGQVISETKKIAKAEERGAEALNAAKELIAGYREAFRKQNKAEGKLRRAVEDQKSELKKVQAELDAALSAARSAGDAPAQQSRGTAVGADAEDAPGKVDASETAASGPAASGTAKGKEPVKADLPSPAPPGLAPSAPSSTAAGAGTAVNGAAETGPALPIKASEPKPTTAEVKKPAAIAPRPARRAPPSLFMAKESPAARKFRLQNMRDLEAARADPEKVLAESEEGLVGWEKTRAGNRRREALAVLEARRKKEAEDKGQAEQNKQAEHNVPAENAQGKQNAQVEQNVQAEHKMKAEDGKKAKHGMEAGNASEESEEP